MKLTGVEREEEERSNLVLLFVQSGCRCMREQKVVCGNVWLTGGVALGAVEAEGIRAAARREDAEIVAEDGIYVGFIDGDPVLDSIPKLAEAHVGVSGEVLSASRRKPSKPPYAAVKNNPRETDREKQRASE